MEIQCSVFQFNPLTESMEYFEAAFDVERFEMIADGLDAVQGIDHIVTPRASRIYMVLHLCLRLCLFCFQLLHLGLEHHIGNQHGTVQPQVQQFIFLLLDPRDALLQHTQLIGPLLRTIFLRELEHINRPLDKDTGQHRIECIGEENLFEFILIETRRLRAFDTLLALRAPEECVELIFAGTLHEFLFPLHHDHAAA